VVEDDSAVRRFTLAALQRYGYRTLEAFDGRIGLATFLQHKDGVDLVLSDVAMPHPGPEMVDEILRLEPNAKVGFMSGTAGFHGLPAHLKGVPVLQKPFTCDRLVEFVQGCLRENHKLIP
jgi:two-component system cell cycle sensor histidine kinase/response regulator CckA